MKKILSIFLLSILVTGCTRLQSESAEELFVSDKPKVQQTETSIGIPTSTPLSTLDDMNKDNITNLKIQENWTIENQGDYLYIRGRVKNISPYDIKYYKLTAQFLDDDSKVLDSDYTNSTQIIRFDEMQEFEIMHKYNEDYKNMRLFIEEVNGEVP